MAKKLIQDVLRNVSKGDLSARKAAKILKGLPSLDLEFANIDCARSARCGFPEVIYCEGKNITQIKRIAKEMLSHEGLLLLTRLSESAYKELKKAFPQICYNKLGRVAYYSKKKVRPKTNKSVLIVTGGTSDIPVAEEARATLEIMGNKVSALYDVGVAGIHRLLNKAGSLEGANVIIVIAGMEGALASVVGGLVSRPVIAVPTSCGYGASFKGIAPLLTMLNSCAPGVAVVNIDNGFGAAYIANLINSA
jgi:NCAIR mutase (PurE)-related protein